jgi:hypothetical protein
MKTSDLQYIQNIDNGYLDDAPSDTYFAVVEDSTLFGYQSPYLWDLVDAIDDPLFKIEIHIYDTYYDQ